MLYCWWKRHVFDNRITASYLLWVAPELFFNFRERNTMCLINVENGVAFRHPVGFIFFSIFFVITGNRCPPYYRIASFTTSYSTAFGHCLFIGNKRRCPVVMVNSNKVQQESIKAMIRSCGYYITRQTKSIPAFLPDNLAFFQLINYQVR